MFNFICPNCGCKLHIDNDFSDQKALIKKIDEYISMQYDALAENTRDLYSKDDKIVQICREIKAAEAMRLLTEYFFE